LESKMAARYANDAPCGATVSQLHRRITQPRPDGWIRQVILKPVRHLLVRRPEFRQVALQFRKVVHGVLPDSTEAE
jgi:hypothetical protein